MIGRSVIFGLLVSNAGRQATRRGPPQWLLSSLVARPLLPPPLGDALKAGNLTGDRLALSAFLQRTLDDKRDRCRLSSECGTYSHDFAAPVVSASLSQAARRTPAPRAIMVHLC